MRCVKGLTSRLTLDFVRNLSSCDSFEKKQISEVGIGVQLWKMEKKLPLQCAFLKHVNSIQMSRTELTYEGNTKTPFRHGWLFGSCFLHMSMTSQSFCYVIQFRTSLTRPTCPNMTERSFSITLVSAVFSCFCSHYGY